jgi:tellurite resistance-related uncharacterized protein
LKALPSNLKVYKSTPHFDQDSIPRAIASEHSTKAGVWGKINVLEGELLYTILTEPSEEVLLSSDKFGVVEPEVIHKVKPLGKVKFFVEFLR